jgi:serine protease Do
MKIPRPAFAGLALMLFSAFAAQAASNDPRETNAVKAFRKAGPAVVGIRALRTVQYQNPMARGFFGPEFFNDFYFGPGVRRQEESMGSGVIINPHGYILTNQHVVEGASKILVSLQNGSEVQADLIGADYKSDLAVLRITAKGQTGFLPMGESSDLMIGEPVVVIGNPFGLGHTLTVGVVSALHRRITVGDRVYGEFIQTDASINPGNSGGAMLNINGELIGITTAIYSKAQGIGFAIPISKAKRVVDDLIAFGSVKPGWLGIEVEDLTAELGSALAVTPGSGVMVSKVWPGSPGEKAGIKAGSVILEFDGKPAPSKQVFKELMGEINRNTQVKIKYAEQGKESSVLLKADEFPAQMSAELCRTLLGIEVAAAKGQGVVISKIDPSSPAGKIGIGRGDLILKVNQSPVSNLDDFYRIIVGSRNQNSVIIVIKRENVLYYVTLPLRG